MGLFYLLPLENLSYWTKRTTCPIKQIHFDIHINIDVYKVTKLTFSRGRSIYHKYLNTWVLLFNTYKTLFNAMTIMKLNNNDCYDICVLWQAITFQKFKRYLPMNNTLVYNYFSCWLYLYLCSLIVSIINFIWRQPICGNIATLFFIAGN